MKEVTWDDLSNMLQKYEKEDISEIKKAYDFAKLLQEGQYRQSGEPYICLLYTSTVHRLVKIVGYAFGSW